MAGGDEPGETMTEISMQSFWSNKKEFEIHRGCSGTVRRVWMHIYVCEKCNCLIPEKAVETITVDTALA